MTEETKQWIAETSQPEYLDRLRAALKGSAKQMSQAEFARRAGCSASNVNFLLNGYHNGFVPKYIWQTAKLYLRLEPQSPAAKDLS
ncbi:MAG TPA: helix-turn-helix transcriptional regulator [Polyangiaceae bacterium]|nr:helix-turn-helix transcriptional regulator [Polyangiaceae bacterium]